MALTIKQEKFCMVYIETGNASEAYRQAYNCENMKPETVNRTAKETLDNPNITARVEQLKNKHAKRHEITIDDLVKELEEARAIALGAATPQASAAVSASMGKAKLLGLIVDKTETKNEHTVKHTKDLTDEELDEELKKYDIVK